MIRWSPVEQIFTAHDCRLQEKVGGAETIDEIKAGSSGPDDVVSYLSNTSFESLCGLVSEPTLKAIAEMGFTQMTEIQAKCIAPLLEVNQCLFSFLQKSQQSNFSNCRL